jgi:hypothetical protein
LPDSPSRDLSSQAASTSAIAAISDNISSLHILTASISLNDPGCVKTHASPKCIKYNSPTLHRSVCAQYDLTSRRGIPSRFFYARGERWSFYTAKTLFGHCIPIQAPGAQRCRRMPLVTHASVLALNWRRIEWRHNSLSLGTNTNWARSRV